MEHERPFRRALGSHRAASSDLAKPAPTPASKGRPASHDLREIFNPILYVNRTGIPRRYLPYDLPPWQTVSVRQLASDQIEHVVQAAKDWQ